MSAGKDGPCLLLHRAWSGVCGIALGLHVLWTWQGKLEKSMLSFFADNEETGWMSPTTAAAVKHMAARTAEFLPKVSRVGSTGGLGEGVAAGVLDTTTEVRMVCDPVCCCLAAAVHRLRFVLCALRVVARSFFEVWTCCAVASWLRLLAVRTCEQTAFFL
jgi:hypothetical protein